MAFAAETDYDDDYAHLGALAKNATYAPRDAGGQPGTTKAVKICWDDATTADYAGGQISPGTTDSILVFWKAGSGAQDPTSGDTLVLSGVTWIIMAVTDTRHGSWRLTVREGRSNTIAV